MKHVMTQPNYPYHAPAQLYPGPEKPIVSNSDVEKEIERIKIVMNESIEAAALSIARLTLVVNRGLDINGDLKRKINWLNVQYSGIHPKNLAKNLRPFMTDVFFKYTPFPTARILVEQGMNPPTGNAYANIVWAGEPYVELITANTFLGFTLGGGISEFLYIDVNELIPAGSGYNIQQTRSMTTAVQDGSVLLYFMNNINGPRGNWFQGQWGGVSDM